MASLSPAQRRAIVLIVIGEMEGISLTRLLKTPYSCRCCGYVAGRSGESREVRKQALAEHEARDCKHPGRKWSFAANASTYHRDWKPDTYFSDCLSQAQSEVINAVLGEAFRNLQIGALEASRELRRQIEEGQKDTDKRAAATALLDRVDIKNASKNDEMMMRWLAELRATEDEPMEEFGPEEHDVQYDWTSSEWESGEDT